MIWGSVPSPNLPIPQKLLDSRIRKQYLITIMNDPVVPTQRMGEKVQISIQLDSELIEQIKHLTNDPS